MTWSGRIQAARERHEAALAAVLMGEFKRLAKDIDPKQPNAALRAHEARVALIIGAHKQAIAVTFGWMTLEMLTGHKIPGKSDSGSLMAHKADVIPPKEPTRAERIGAVLAEIARTVARGALAGRVAELLGRNRLLLSNIEVALLAAPEASPRAIAVQLLEDRRVSASLAVAYAQAAEVAPELEAIEAQLAPDARARRTSSGPDQGPVRPSNGQTGSNQGPPKPPAPPPPTVPPSGSSGGRAPPPRRRSRFSLLVEQLVREEAPFRARRIAAGSGRIIAEILGPAAAGGWSEERTAKALATILGGEVTRHRARTIARTELGSAQDGASFALAEDEAANGAEIEKSWLTAGDGRESEGGRIRDAHADAEGQTVALNQPFIVGGERMRYPHDPRCSLKNIVNCRCHAIYRLRYQQSTPPPAR